jgi:pimeloyl-ACP methyl ester carboxylesterase
MRTAGFRAAVAFGLGLVLFGPGTAGREPEGIRVPAGSSPTPRQVWDRFRATLPPLDYRIEKDEIVPSDTDPRLKLRRIEVKFYSQIIDGRAWGHPCVVFLPADRKVYDAARRRGKIVVVGQRSWDGLATGPWRDPFLGNYGEPIAALTGYPTMICPVPGEYDGTGGQEISIGFLGAKSKESQDPADHNYFRLAVPYLRALDVMAGILRIDPQKVRAIIGGHSKRATSAFTAAAIDPERIAGVVYMGNESTFESLAEPPWRTISPAFSRAFVKAEVLYIGGTNEDGYRMYNINRIQEMMKGAWTIAMVPNYRHASVSEHHFLDWRMWVAHVFDGRPLTAISDLSFREADDGFVWGGRPMEAGTVFRARIASPNKIIQAKVWYVYNDDPPYWRDLMWYPEFMIPVGDGYYEGYVTGELPDAWLVEVKDIAFGAPGYLTSLPQDITGLPTATRTSRGSRSRLWEPKKKKD